MFSVDIVLVVALQIFLVLGYSAVVGAMVRKWHEAGGEGFFPLSTPKLAERPPREDTDHGLHRAVLMKKRALELWQEAGTRYLTRNYT